MFGPVAYWIGCFALGGVPFALLIGKAKGVDIRSIGSRNIGATNVARTLGLRWGVLTFAFDAGKGFAAIQAGRVLTDSALLAPQPSLLVVGGGAAILGHCYPVYLRFRGGKGVAAAAGVVCALQPVIAAVLLGVWVIMVGLVRNIGVSSSIAALVACALGIDLLLELGWSSVEGDRALGGFLVLLGGLVLFRHRQNIRDYLAPRTAGGMKS